MEGSGGMGTTRLAGFTAKVNLKLKRKEVLSVIDKSNATLIPPLYAFVLVYDSIRKTAY